MFKGVFTAIFRRKMRKKTHGKNRPCVVLFFNIEGQSINKSSVKSYISRHSGSPEIVILLLRLSGTASIIAPSCEMLRRKSKNIVLYSDLPLFYYTPQNLFWQVFFHKNFSDIFPPLYDHLPAQKRIEESRDVYAGFFKTAYHIRRLGRFELIAGIVSFKPRKEAFVSDGRAQSIE